MTNPPPPPPHAFARDAPQIQPPYGHQVHNMNTHNSNLQYAPQSPMIVRSHKEIGIAYILWLFLGTLGVHRFYLGRNGTGIAQVILSVVGWATAILLVGFVFLAVVWVWVIVDAFLIPSMTREANGRAA